MNVRLKNKLYYESDNATLYLGDALDVLTKFNDNTFDMIFADPPYNLSNDGFTCHSGKAICVNKGEWDRSRGFTEDTMFHDAWLKSCNRILKPNGTIWVTGTYHSIYICGYILQKQEWHLLNDIAWFKQNASPNLSCRMFTASHETLLWAKKNSKSKQTFNYEYLKNSEWAKDFIKKKNKQMRSVWAINTPLPVEKKFGKHPTQKPLALLERVILASTMPGDLILDPFCGSATSGVAAINNGRRFVGIDAQEEYLEKLAVPRLRC